MTTSSGGTGSRLNRTQTPTVRRTADVVVAVAAVAAAAASAAVDPAVVAVAAGPPRARPPSSHHKPGRIGLVGFVCGGIRLRGGAGDRPRRSLRNDDVARPDLDASRTMTTAFIDDDMLTEMAICRRPSVPQRLCRPPSSPQSAIFRRLTANQKSLGAKNQFGINSRSFVLLFSIIDSCSSC